MDIDKKLMKKLDRVGSTEKINVLIKERKMTRDEAVIVATWLKNRVPVIHEECQLNGEHDQPMVEFIRIKSKQQLLCTRQVLVILLSLFATIVIVIILVLLYV